MSRGGWLGRLSAGLARSSARLADGIGGIFAGRRLDEATLGELEDLLIGADLGVETAAKLTEGLARQRVDKGLDGEEVRALLAADIARILEPVAVPLAVDPAHGPHVVLVVGVNGTGKTTTVGKLAKRLRDEGRRVMMAAGDTFRAAGVSQLELWGERVGCPVVSRATGADASGLVFDALERARDEGADVLLVDTAGRLQNRADLMAELQKIIRVMKKLDPSAPHSCLLVLDATTGQNTHAQVGVFQEMTDVTGLIVTKLDGTAKGGVLVALAGRFGLPVHAIGVGETEDDLQPFEAGAFADRLMGLAD